MKNRTVSANTVDVTIDTYSSKDSDKHLVARNDITEDDSDRLKTYSTTLSKYYKYIWWYYK